MFLTVLYARADTGLLSRHLLHGVFTMFRSISRKQQTQKAKLLSFAGPTILVSLVIVWFFGLTLAPRRYVALRREWDPDVATLSRSMRINLNEVDPAVARA